jgi:hypothetical protein
MYEWSGVPLDIPCGVCDSVCALRSVFEADFLHSVIFVSVCIGRECNALHHYIKKFKHHVKKRKLIGKEEFLAMNVAANPSLLKMQLTRVFLCSRENVCTEKIQCHVLFKKRKRARRNMKNKIRETKESLKVQRNSSKKKSQLIGFVVYAMRERTSKRRKLCVGAQNF